MPEREEVNLRVEFSDELIDGDPLQSPHVMALLDDARERFESVADDIEISEYRHFRADEWNALSAEGADRISQVRAGCTLADGTSIVLALATARRKPVAT